MLLYVLLICSGYIFRKTDEVVSYKATFVEFQLKQPPGYVNMCINKIYVSETCITYNLTLIC